MFDFFKDMYLEVNKIEPQATERVSVSKKEKLYKYGIYVLCCVYIFTAIMGSVFAISIGLYYRLIKYALLLALCIFTIVFISMKDTKKQRIGLIVFGIFVLLNFLLSSF